MSSFEKLKIAKGSQFERLTGVKKEIFNLELIYQTRVQNTNFMR